MIGCAIVNQLTFMYQKDSDALRRTDKAPVPPANISLYPRIQPYQDVNQTIATVTDKFDLMEDVMNLARKDRASSAN